MSKIKTPVIVKVQVPLYSSDPGFRKMLVYAKGGRRKRFQNATPDVLAAIGTRAKRYFEATETVDGWDIGLPVSDQPW